jgi:hypothetical protein
MRPVQLPNGRMSKPARIAELRGPAADIVAIRELQKLRFDPRIKGRTTYAFAKYTTAYEARRWARENGHAAYRPHMWQLASPDGPFRLCSADQIASLLRIFFLESSFITHSMQRRPALARRPPQGP